MSVKKPLVSVLFVCSGNICRSPALQAVFQKQIDEKGLTDQFYLDSAALTPYYLGEMVDKRMRKAGGERGLTFSDHKARLFEASDFNIFNYILVAEKQMQVYLQSLIGNPKEQAKVHLATEYSQKYPLQDIPDPYDGGPKDFQTVLDMAEDVAKGFLQATFFPL
jgi:protein-tyrosine phosphatase